MSDNKYWIDDIMNAIETATPVIADKQFALKMEQIALKSLSTKKMVSLPWVMAVAASFLLLLSANVMIFSHSVNSTSTNEQYAQISDYENSMYLMPTKFIEYE